MATNVAHPKNGSSVELCCYGGRVPQSQKQYPVVDDEHARAVQAVRALARASRVLERASGELNLAHYRVLSAVASGDERASRVAARLTLGKPTVSAAVDALCRRGLMTRVAAADDQRAVALSLTAPGWSLLNRVEEEMVAKIRSLSARTPDPQRLIESLAWMGGAIDEAHAERMAAG
jgi:DNA-binding MarR family transcriptional regulator